MTSSSRLLSVALLLACANASAAAIDNASVTTLAVAQQTNGNSDLPLAVSHNGRYAVFLSAASNLLAADSNRRNDLFLYDAQSDSVEIVSLRADGAQSDGGSIASAAVTDDGRYVFFSSAASDLVPGGGLGGAPIYVRDRVAGTTQRASLANGQPLADQIGFNGASADGRYLLVSTSVALQPADTNEFIDLYRLDRNTGSYTLVSAGTGGVPANWHSWKGNLSADGSRVVFSSSASNLVAGDTPSTQDLFLRDVDAGITVLAGRTTAGQFYFGHRQPSPASGNSLSADGRYVVFNTNAALDPADTNLGNDGYLFDYDTLSVRRITLDSTGAQMAGGSLVDSISADGSVITFTSPAAVLPGQAAGPYRSYRRVLSQLVPELIEVPASGYLGMLRACHLAGDAASAYCGFPVDWLNSMYFGAFSNLYQTRFPQTGLRRVSRPLATPTAVSNDDSGYSGVSASADGRYVVFDSLATNLVVADLNGRRDIFLRDRVTGTTERINRLPSGSESPCDAGRSHISADGRYIVFESCPQLVPGLADNGYQQILRYDRTGGVMELVSRSVQGAMGNRASYLRDISADGGVVAYNSGATNLLAATGNIRGDSYVSDLNAATVEVVSRHADGQSAEPGWGLQLSATGRYAIFSHFRRLIPADTNDVEDVYVFDRLTAQLDRVNLDAAGNQLTERNSAAVDVSADGRLVLFDSLGPVPGAGGSGYYVRDRVSGVLDQVNVDDDGQPLPYSCTPGSMSDDGSLVALRCYSDASTGLYGPNTYGQPHVFDRRSRSQQRVTPFGANSQLELIRLTGNGDHLVFSTRDSNLAADAGNNHVLDVFIASNIGDVLFADGLGDP